MNLPKQPTSSVSDCAHNTHARVHARAYAYNHFDCCSKSKSSSKQTHQRNACKCTASDEKPTSWPPKLLQPKRQRCQDRNTSACAKAASVSAGPSIPLAAQGGTRCRCNPPLCGRWSAVFPLQEARWLQRGWHERHCLRRRRGCETQRVAVGGKGADDASDGRSVPAWVTTGTPALSTSVAVPWALYRGVSRNRCASPFEAKRWLTGGNFAKKMRCL